MHGTALPRVHHISHQQYSRGKPGLGGCGEWEPGTVPAWGCGCLVLGAPDAAPVLGIIGERSHSIAQCQIRDWGTVGFGVLPLPDAARAQGCLWLW